MKKTHQNKTFFTWIFKHKRFFLFLAVFIPFLALRIYGMDAKYPFGWDQVDNAWAAKNMIINHNFPLVGMVAKQNTGFFIGPLYYYIVGLFYLLTNLNPVASQYMALATSISTFFIILFVVGKIFNFRIALLACFINSVAASGFFFDAIQWPVSLLPGVSLIIFYFLYKILEGKEKYIFGLLTMIGLTFHLHFTAVFFPIIVLLCLPLFPRNRKMLLYLLFSIPLFLIWFVPNIIAQMQNSSQLNNMSNYLNVYYHGFHLRRFMQLIGDGLIQFDPYLFFAQIKPFKVLIIPIFMLVFLREKLTKDRIVFAYLMLVFFLVPWAVFSTYKGEISDYYFVISRFIALFILSYLLSKLLFTKMLPVKIFAVIFFIYYSYLNLNSVINSHGEGGLKERLIKVKFNVETSKRIEFQDGVPEPYIYYYLMRKKGIVVY